MKNIAWVDSNDLPDSFSLMGINGNVLDVGNSYLRLRKGDILFAPRINNQFLVSQTPLSENVSVLGDFCNYPYAYMRTVAIYFGVTIQTIKRWCRLGIIPADKNKNHWQVPYTLVMDGVPELVVGDEMIILSPARAD